jgi:hypothetical protein
MYFRATFSFAVVKLTGLQVFEYTLAPDSLRDIVSGIFGSVDRLGLYAVPHQKRT